jgi:putative endonuclease
MEYVVYILYSKVHNKIYIGFTSDLVSRFKSHNKLGKKGWTIKYRPWEVIYCDFFDGKIQAQAREKQLKGAKCRESMRAKINTEYTVTRYISF